MTATPPSRPARTSLCGLAGDAEPGADLGPGVTPATQTLDRLGDGVVQFVGKPGREAECLDIAVCDAATVGARMNSSYSSFSTVRRRRFGVKPALTLDRLPLWPLPVGWSAMSASSACSFRPGHKRVIGWGPSPDRCRGCGAGEWRSSCGCLMLWTGRGLHASGVCPCGGDGPKDHAVSRCLTAAAEYDHCPGESPGSWHDFTDAPAVPHHPPGHAGSPIRCQPDLDTVPP
jgi:hypothetical protein